MDRKSRASASFLGLLCAVFVAACSGGGGSSPAPQPTPTLGGSGIDVTFDQTVNFTVIVPAPVTGSAAAARRKHAKSGTAATNPYVSPNTASVTLQIGTVNAQSPRVLPPLVTVNISCPANTGCSVPIQNVRAAKGVDRFAVQTFSGPGGTGNIISSGFIDVTVPSAKATSFGGTALTVGGYVQSISLALNIANTTFTWNAPAAGTIDVNALDPAGAIIIGSDQLANPIQVSLPGTDGGAFTINGAQQVTLQAPAQTIALAYNGTVLLTGTVTASTTDENSQPVATSIPIPIAPPTPTPRPKPTPTPPGQTPPPARSLYVYDAGSDRIIEYAGVNEVENGQPFSTTPRRIFEVAPPPALSATLNGCGFTSGTPLINSFALSANGTLYAQTTCNDAATNTLQYTFMYAASTQEAGPAQSTPVPPVPTNVFSVVAGANAAAQGIALDEPHGTVFVAYFPAASSSAFTGDNIIGVPLNGVSNPTTNFGSDCLQELGQSSSCTANSTSAYGYAPYSFAVDASGILYVPNGYDGTNTPPGPASQAVVGEPAILVFSSGISNPAPTPISALAGFSDELGWTSGPPAAIAIEGTTMYVLAAPGTTTNPVTGNSVYSGLSGCPFPSANATPDTPAVDAAGNPIATTCAGGGFAEYIAAFPNVTQTLRAVSNAGTNVVAPPALMLGGDIDGGFGLPQQLPGQQLAVRDGFAYVLNALPPSGGAPEIDVYDTNHLTGYTTQTAPVTRLVFDPAIQPSSIAIGPTGTGIGGQALLRRPARAHHDLKAWARLLKQRRQALLNRRRR